MKPPVRTRSAPLRYEESGSRVRVTPWKLKEKLLLLKALKEQRQRKELDVQALQALLPQKSHAEIVSFIHLMKGRVAREAVQRDYQRYQEEKKIKESQVLAPIEVWTNLAEKVSLNLEDAITAAFSQILTIAATEPISLLHSVPKKPTGTTGKKIINSSAESGPSDSSSPASHNVPEPTTGSHAAKAVEMSGTSQSQEAVPVVGEEERTSPESEEFNVDFEKIYKYLSALTRGGKMPELSNFESAVILDLLMSLPDELIQLDCASLRTHMYQSFKHLNSPWPSQEGPKKGQGQEESAATIPPVDAPQESCSSGKTALSKQEKRDCTSEGSNQNGAAISQPANQMCRENTIPDKGPQWKELGVCPLNSFLIPVKLLSQTVKN